MLYQHTMEDLMPDDLKKNRVYENISLQKAIDDVYAVYNFQEEGLDELPAALFKSNRLYTLKVDQSVALKSIVLEGEVTSTMKYFRIENWSASTFEDKVFDLPELLGLRLKSSCLKKLSSALGRAKKMKYLILECDALEELPEEISGLTNLEFLVIQSKKLKTLPAGIGGLKRLETFFLEAAALTVFPAEFCQLPKLKYWEIKNIPAKYLPDNLGALQSLETIKGRHCNFETLPSSIGQLQKLKTLYFEYTPFQYFPPEMAQMPKLVYLDLENCKLETIPDFFFDFEHGMRLNLSHNQLKTIPPSIKNKKNGLNLVLSYNQITHFPEEAAFAPVNGLYFEGNVLEEVPEQLVAGDTLRYISFDMNDYDYHNSEYKELEDYITGYKKTKFNQDLKVPFYHIWLKKEAELDNMPIETMLKAHAFPLPRIQWNALYALAHHSDQSFSKDGFGAGAVLTILGKTSTPKPQIKADLKEMGIGYTAKLTDKTTHLLLGEKFKEKLSDFAGKPYVFMIEQQLIDLLNEKNKPYLLEENNASNIEQIQQLVESANEDNIQLALELIQGGGMPQELLPELFSIHKMSSNTKIQAKAKKLLAKVASTELLAAMKERTDFRNRTTNGHAFARNIEVFESTELDTAKVAMYFFLFKHKEAGGADYIFKKGSEELIHYFIKNHLIVNNEIVIHRYNTEIYRFPLQICAYPELKRVSIVISIGTKSGYPEQYAFPDELLQLTNLECLEIKTSGLVLKEIPKCLAEHPSLKKLVWYQRHSQLEQDFIKLRPDIEVVSIY